MTGGTVSGLSKQQRAKLDAQLDKWQQDLVNLTKRNKLLHFKHTKTSSLEIVQPSMSHITTRLDGAGWTFHLPPEELERDDDRLADLAPAPDSNTLVTSKRLRREVLGALRALERTSNQTMLDTGLWVLYMAFGMLKWTDPADGKVSESPLLLVPVVLERPGQPTDFLLRSAEDDDVINPALTIKLANDFGITLPPIDELDGSPASVIRAVRDATARQKGWVVEERVVLTTFTFHKEAMYRDLLTNRELIASHALVQLAAVGPEAGSDRFSFEPLSDDRIEELAPPETLVSIRDADSTQRKCIVAARDGRSFVMDGPPGTGKSQTISNIIAELLNAGKSVLFVSEKAAALEVVSNRLDEAGLSEFVLELHSHKATRKEVAIELGRSLELSPQARSAFKETDRANLIRLRKELNEYAVAANERRVPLGQSLHQVIGRIVQLKDCPQGPVATLIDRSLAPQRLGEIVDAAARLGRAWRPIELGDTFLWRSLRETTYSAARQRSLSELVQQCVDAVAALSSSLDDIDVSLGLGWSTTHTDAAALHRFLAAVESLPLPQRGPAEWLTSTTLTDTRALLEARQAQVTELLQQDAEAERRTAGSWRALPLGRAASARAARVGVTLGGLSIDSDRLQTARATDVREWMQLRIDARARIATLRTDAQAVCDEFGLRSDGLSIDRCRELAELASLIGSATPPEPAWLSPFTQAALVEAASVLRELVADYRRRNEALSATFTEGVLSLDLVGLRARLSSASGIHRLGGAYRADKRTLAASVVGGKVTRSVIERLDEAIAWSELRGRLLSAETTHSSILGSYYQGSGATDLGRLDRALEVAQRAIELCGPVVPPDLPRQVGLGGNPSPAAVAAGQRLATSTSDWMTAIQPQLEQIGIGSTSAALSLLDDWLAQCEQPLTELLDSVAATDDALHRSSTVSEAIELLEIVDNISRLRDELLSTAEDDASRLGTSWQGEVTAFSDIERSLAWAEAVRSAAGGSLTADCADALVDLPPSAEHVARAMSATTKAWSAIADLFERPWRDRLTADFDVSLQDGNALLDELRGSLGDIEEWSRFVSARQELTDAGLGSVVEFLESSKAPADQVALVVERSVLEAWVDDVIASDDRLKTLGPAERNHVVEQFRRLDRDLIANAAATVINSCAQRRPATTLGAAGIIRREAQKKTRHKAIRRLLEETREVSQALKPCFMMSPLSVSQFLPSSVQFDVVVFDEASQVKPADAVNCIYRGRQLIVAGDPRQLPPTNFFEQVAEESADDYDDEAPEDFESVLDIYLGSGLPTLPLQWHYRSQHESLITYSNYGFYDGMLHTFPGAVEEAEDVGVVLVPVEGVYRRGGARDNPIEAEKVVERVLFHRRAHPMLTLGVVAFSSAQESAIVAELERLRYREPEVAELLTSTNRLDGFFVKNLENVQGDERDIIIFSIGYGPDENGKFTEQLGPLGQKGGERRLNVAITRARRRVEVVASVTAGRFPGTSSAPGVRHLQRYLDFAERGSAALSLDLDPSEGDAESVFEEMVLAYIRSLGHNASPQVGVAGYRIDIGVRHPARPGEFVLGVECDGAAYHSSRVARDRDRLRQEILEGLGWRIHRIWGTSWFRDRAGQEKALIKAIEDAISGKSNAPSIVPASVARPTVELQAVDLDGAPDWSEEYRVSGWAVRGWYASSEVHAVPTAELVIGIERIVRDEGPIHEDVLRRRLADAYGVKRIGDRIATTFNTAIASAVRQKGFERLEKVFLQVPGAELVVRTPTEDDERSRRTVAQVSAAERQLAIISLVEESHRVSRDDLCVAFGRLFGWKRIGADIDAAFDRDLKALIKAGKLAVDGSDLLAV